MGGSGGCGVGARKSRLDLEGETQMSWRVKVELDFMGDGIGAHIGERFPDGLTVVEPLNLAMRVARGQEMAIAREPALRLPDGLGRTLLDALALHYGGAVDARTSRADMLAERARVDKLLDAVVVIAKGGS